MKNISKLLVLMAVVALIAVGCGGAKPAAKGGEHGTKDITEQVKAANFEIVDTAFVKAMVGHGIFDPAKVIIDARPAKKYDGGHIPTSISIPDTALMKSPEKFLAMLDEKKVQKDALLVTFCGGFTCIKSLNAAKVLRDKGYTNVKVYLAGMPEWKKANYAEVSHTEAKKMFDKGTGTFLDARPFKKFKQSTIPGSANLPDTSLVAGKQALVIYCGGFKCEKSHKVAQMLVDMGVPAKMVKVFAGGMPEWKQMKYPLGAATAGPKKDAEKPAMKVSVKLGEDAGTVDKKWFVNAVNTKTLPADVVVIDVRTANERKGGFIEGSISADSNIFYKSGCDKYLANLPKDKTFVLHCASGGRAGEMYDNLTLPKEEDGCALPKDKVFYLDGHTSFDGGTFGAK